MSFPKAAAKVMSVELNAKDNCVRGEALFEFHHDE